MSYQINFSNTTKTPITIQDNTLNQETSVALIGKNYAGYGPALSSNFIHLLENFANITPPTTPIQGQLWYDTTSSLSTHPELKVWDGSTWTTTSNIIQGAAAPSSQLFGDLWVDTSTQQLKVYFGSWIVIGPQYSTGLKTGAINEVFINSNTNTEVSVISLYAEDYRVAIISKELFTPKVAIVGFSTIYQGVTLNKVGSTIGSTASPKFWGTASEADSLIVNGSVVPSLNFLRSDMSSTTNNPFNIQSDGGLSIGSDLGFKIYPSGNSIVVSSTVLDKSIDFKVNNAGTNQNLARLNANGRVSIGVNHINPQAVLDISIANSLDTVSVNTDGIVQILNTTDSSGLTESDTASLWTDGGLSVKLSSNFGGTINAFGSIILGNIDSFGEPISGPVIVPGADSVYDIGDSNNHFRNIYADSLIGNVIGNLTGSFTGNITGSATTLASFTDYSIVGDINSDTIHFNGSTATSDVTENNPLSGVTFTTTLSDGFISNKEELVDSLSNDYLLIYRPLDINYPSNPYGIKKTLKSTFVSSIPAVPVGAIFPFAGASTSLPMGYLLCDGSDVLVSDYPVLFQTIKYIYTTSIVVGSFRLPDLRGRFPLGPDNMDNTGVGSSANRVTASSADNIGQSGGSEAHTIGLTNIPDHKHTLKGSLGNQYYAAGLSGGTQDASAVANRGLAPVNTTNGYGLTNSGSVDSVTTSVPLNTMNPFLTINYIIFTG